MTASQVGDPLQVPGDRTASAVRAWVAFYTKGLRTEESEDRQALIDADLWDEARAAEWMGETSGLARQRLGRLVRGVPSDISWRLEHKRHAVKQPRRTEMRTSKIWIAVLGTLAVLYAVFLLAGLLTQTDFREYDGVVIATVGFGLTIIGLLLAIPRPREGFIVGMLGIGLAFLTMWWLFPFYLPVPIVLGYRLIRAQDAAKQAVPSV